MDPMTMAIASAGISAAGSIGSSLLTKRPKETALQRQKRQLIDEIIRSLGGEGKFNDLFNMDEAAFQKSVVDPAKARFNNQWAPQIQQSYISTGQQRGTGLDDTLSRAGVDMDQLINEQYSNFQQNALNRKASAINSITGGYTETPEELSFGDKLQSGAAGYLSSSDFGTGMNSILDAYRQKSTYNQDVSSGGGRKGYAT